MKISIIGTGYVGLVSGACFAEIGHDVVCVDVDREKVASINRGEAPIYEQGLTELLRRHVGTRLSATVDLGAAVQDSEITFIAVGTPFDGNTIDLSYIRRVACDVGAALRSKQEYHVVVVKSTVVPGTTDDVVTPLLEQASGRRAGIDFGVGMNPEFLTEGVAVQDFMEPDRIVLGGVDQRTVDALAKVYAPFSAVPTLRTNNKTAEMIKYTSNAVLATLISFSNEFGNLCTRLGGVDIAEVMQGLHKARYFTTQLENGTRITAPITSFLYAGCGFGGSCLPKDIKALAAHGQAVGASMPLLETVIRINLNQPQQIIDILERNFSSLYGLKVSVLGVAFKPDTDDVRESPALPIVHGLLARGVTVSLYDPVATESAKKVLPVDRIRFLDTLESALTDVDATVLITSWDEFRQIPELLNKTDVPPLVVDGRRFLDKRQIARYAGIGL
jgi:UDPglucose 6-dehydrogenase/GDP-mannose 6-dehydrogenase